MRFRNLEDASRTIQASKPAELLYPGSENWTEFTVDPYRWKEVCQQLKQHSGGVLYFAGPHGSGKTFFAFYLGYWWNSQEKWCRAFYTSSPSNLALDEVRSQWEATRKWKWRCLWIVDNVQTDREGIFHELIEMFDDCGLFERRHWLLGFGWSSLGELETFAFPLTKDTIVSALRHVNPKFAEDEELVELLTAGPVGLRQIMWAAREKPALLRQRQIDILKHLWIEHILEQIPLTYKESIALMARLKFLGLPFIPLNPKESDVMRKLSRSVGWIRRDSLGSEWCWQIVEEEIAQSVLNKEIGKERKGEALASKFLAPLCLYVTELLADGRLSYVGRVLHALRSSSREDLAEWIDGESVPDQKRLIRDFVRGDFLDDLSAALHKAVVKDSTIKSLVAAARTIATLRTLCRPWAKEVTTSILKEIQISKLLSLPSNPSDALAKWRALASFAFFAADQRLIDFVQHAAHEEVVRKGFQKADWGERGKILDETARVSEELYQTILDYYYKLVAEEIVEAPPKRTWRRLSVLSKRDPNMAIELLKKLGRKKVADLVCCAPQAARSFLSNFRDQSRERVQRLFTMALRDIRTVSIDDIQAWSTPRDFASLVYLAKEVPTWVDVEPMFRCAAQIASTANPAALIDAARDVATYAQDSELREYFAKCVLESLAQGEEPFLSRLRALAQLNLRLLTPELLTEFIPRWRELNPGDIFWFLWLLTGCIMDGQELAQRLANEIVSNWEFILGKLAPLTTLGIAGLCMFVLDYKLDYHEVSLPLEQLSEPGPHTPLPSSPSLTACQLLALAKTVAATTDLGYKNLEWLVQQLAAPSEAFRKNWRAMQPRLAWRRTLAVVWAALQGLIQSGLHQLAHTLAHGIAAPSQDEIWNRDISVRLEAVLAGVGKEGALQMLKRCCDAWLSILQKIENLESILWFLRRIVSLAIEGDVETRICVARLLDVVKLRVPSEREHEIITLERRLEET